MCDTLSTAIRREGKQRHLAVIAEVKQQRYRGTDLLRGRPAAEIARVYRDAGATALSVVTSPWFGGTMQLLESVASADCSLPILRKDLIRNEKGIRETRNAGATAVLLALPLLGLKRLVDLVDTARAHSLEPFIEVSSAEEVAQLLDTYDGIIAINNSDIKTNETSGEGIERSIALFTAAQQRPPSPATAPAESQASAGHPGPSGTRQPNLAVRAKRLWISASRISGVEDVRRLAQAGLDGILIGTHLLESQDLNEATCGIVAAARSAQDQSKDLKKCPDPS